MTAKGEAKCRRGELPVLDSVGDYFDGQFLGIADGFFARGTVRHDTGQFQSFRDPATIIFPIDFYGEIHN